MFACRKEEFLKKRRDEDQQKRDNFECKQKDKIKKHFMKKYRKIMKSKDQAAKIGIDENGWKNQVSKIRAMKEYKQMILYYYDELNKEEKKEYDQNYINYVHNFLTNSQQNSKTKNREISISDICKNNPKAYMDYKRRNMRIIKDYISELEFQTKIISLKETEKQDLNAPLNCSDIINI